MTQLAQRLARQSQACRSLGSPLYADLLERAAHDVGQGGPVGELLAPVASLPSGSLVSLRMLAGVHALVLQRRAPGLAVFYPTVGGTPGDPDVMWREFRGLVAREQDELAPWLSRPPQTNEVGRAAPLLGALRAAATLCGTSVVDLVELGCSAGLNLRADRLPIGPGLAIDTAMMYESAVRIGDRVGVDTVPLDPTTEEGRLRLTAYVWPDQLERFERLKAGLAVVPDVNVDLRQSSAGAYMRGVTLRRGRLTVVWHSIMWQYVPAEEQREILAERDRLAADASADSPFAHLSFEPATMHDYTMDIVLRTWPAGLSLRLGAAPAHGIPIEWFDPPRPYSQSEQVEGAQ